MGCACCFFRLATWQHSSASVTISVTVIFMLTANAIGAATICAPIALQSLTCILNVRNCCLFLLSSDGGAMMMLALGCGGPLSDRNIPAYDRLLDYMIRLYLYCIYMIAVFHHQCLEDLCSLKWLVLH